MIKTICVLTVLVLCLSLNGCAASERSDFEVAADLYLQGRYSEAGEYFQKVLESDGASETVHVGYAYNLVALGDYNRALDELIAVQDAFADPNMRISLRKTILDIYIAQENYAGAARVCDEIVTIAGEGNIADFYGLEGSEIRADMYRSEGDDEKLEQELKNIIRLKTFAQEEYCELYSLYIKRDMREERLTLADEIVAYMTGHASYIENYTQIISVLFDAAKVASYCDWTRTSEDYFVLAEGFITLAQDKGLTEEEALKYKVIIAERRGKMEVAYKILGVYLNHCPDDSAAQKELSYLSDRLGITE